MQKMTKEYATYLQELVKQAGLVDKNRKVFGSEKHDYQLKPVISLSEVQAYEQKHNIKLPSEYVFFITQVGNGGAGPFYGIYGIHIAKDYLYYTKSGTPFLSSKLTKDVWAEKLAPMDDDNCPDEIFDQIEEEILQGTTSIGTQGCSYETLAIAEGAEENRIFYINNDWDTEGMPFDTKTTFLEWYENFFKEIIIGNSVSNYGYCKIQTQQQAIQTFSSTNDKSEQSDCLNSFLRFPKLEQETIDFIQALSDDDFPAHKLLLLLRYDTKNGLQLFDTFLTEKPKVAISASISVPKECLPYYYDKFLHTLYTMEDGSKKCSSFSSYHDVLLYRLQDCPQFKAKDIIPFLDKKGISDSDLRTALYTLCNAKDKIDYIDRFIDYMLHGSYHVAHTALQSISNVSHPALKEICPVLWEKYTDSWMRSNLKILCNTNGVPIPIEKKQKGLPK